MSKISQLNDGGSIAASDAVPVARGTGNVKITNLRGELDAKENAGAAASAVSAHEAEGDPHTGYLTAAEADVAYEALGAVADHEALADPHPGYLTPAEASVAYATVAHTHAGGSEAFPVGAVFIAVVSTDPNSLLGYGTWQSMGAGKVLVGVDTGDADFNVAEATGGAKTVTPSGTLDLGLYVAKGTVSWPAGVPAFAGTTGANHQHELPIIHTSTTIVRFLPTGTFGVGASRVPNARVTTTATGAMVADVTNSGVVMLSSTVTGQVPAGVISWPADKPAFVGATGSGSGIFTGVSHSRMPPFITAYFWKRTA